MRRIMSMVTLALAMAAMMAPMASGAQATEPVVEDHHAERTVVIADCGDFQVLDSFVLDFTERFFFDQSGTLVRIVSTVSGTDTFINSETGKEIPTATSHNAVIIDPEAVLGATNGVILRVTVPGSGAVLLDVGRIVSNKDFSVITFEAGPHQFYDGDLAGLCAALE